MSAAFNRALAALLAAFAGAAGADVPERVVDVPTRPGITQRVLLLEPAGAKAAVILYAGGHGGLQLTSDGAMKWGRGNFVVRSRQLFAEQGLAVAVADAPSDRQDPPYLGGFRQRPESAADARALIAWLRERTRVPVWIVGTSAGTQSAAFLAHELAGREGADGVVLTASVLRDRRGRSVLDMPLERVAIPVLVVHHQEDGCVACPFSEVPELMRRLTGAPRKALVAMRGGQNRGDPCEAFAHHGFNGLERDVVARIAAWIPDP